MARRRETSTTGRGAPNERSLGDDAPTIAACLLPGKSRRAFGHERGDPFGVIGRATGPVLKLGLELESSLEISLPGRSEGPLREGKGDRRTCSELLRHLAGGGHE